MTVGHLEYNRTTNHGAALYSALRDLEEGRDNLLRVVATLIQMKDGGSLTSYAVDKFGFTDTTAATNALSELESAKGALDTAAATLNQLFNKFRNG